jgi:hypothetical protein
LAKLQTKIWKNFSVNQVITAVQQNYLPVIPQYVENISRINRESLKKTVDTREKAKRFVAFIFRSEAESRLSALVNARLRSIIRSAPGLMTCRRGDVEETGLDRNLHTIVGCRRRMRLAHLVVLPGCDVAGSGRCMVMGDKKYLCSLEKQKKGSWP